MYSCLQRCLFSDCSDLRDLYQTSTAFLSHATAGNSASISYIFFSHTEQYILLHSPLVRMLNDFLIHVPYSTY